MNTEIFLERDLNYERVTKNTVIELGGRLY